MRTAMQELMNDIEIFSPDTFRLIIKTFQVKNYYLEKEKQQIIDACIEFGVNSDETNRKRGEEYYNQTYKTN
jgi:hypothetical protein